MRAKLAALATAALISCGALTAPVQAQAALTDGQVTAVLLLLAAFGADDATITDVRSVLGGAPTSAASTDGSLAFAPALQPPALEVAPGTARVPFTTLTLANKAAFAVTVYALTVERTGSASDSSLAAIVLVGQDGTELARAGALDTKHQASLAPAALTLAPGQSATLTVAADIADKKSRNKRAGLTIVAINASAPLSGALPLSGTLHRLD